MSVVGIIEKCGEKRSKKARGSRADNIPRIIIVSITARIPLCYVYIAWNYKTYRYTELCVCVHGRPQKKMQGAGGGGGGGNVTLNLLRLL